MGGRSAIHVITFSGHYDKAITSGRFAICDQINGRQRCGMELVSIFTYFYHVVVIFIVDFFFCDIHEF